MESLTAGGKFDVCAWTVWWYLPLQDLPDLSLESVTLGLSFLVGKAGEEVMVTRECLDDVLPMFTLLKIPWMSDDQNNNILDPKTGEVKVGSF